MWNALIEKIAALIKLPMAEWTYVDILILTLMSVVLFFLVKYVLKILKVVFKALGKGFKNLSAKKRCSKIQCPHCGRMLDRCVCEANKNRSYSYRLRKYRREMRELRNK